MTRQARQQTAAGPPGLLERAASLANEAVAFQVLAEAKAYIGQVNRAARCHSGRIAASNQQLAAPNQQLARCYAPFVIKLLRAAMDQLAVEQPPALKTAIAQLASFSLEGLSSLRKSLKGKPYEPEMQRYMLVRRLVLVAAYKDAAHHAWLLYEALCCQDWQSAAEVLPVGNKVEPQPLPKAENSSNSEIASLVMGAALNLLLSLTEQGVLHHNSSKILTIVRDFASITSWLR